MNCVHETETFYKLYSAAEKLEQTWINRIKDQLMENLSVGKPLRYDWFREKNLVTKDFFTLSTIKPIK